MKCIFEQTNASSDDSIALFEKLSNLLTTVFRRLSCVKKLENTFTIVLQNVSFALQCDTISSGRLQRVFGLSGTNLSWGKCKVRQSDLSNRRTFRLTMKLNGIEYPYQVVTIVKKNYKCNFDDLRFSRTLGGLDDRLWSYAHGIGEITLQQSGSILPCRNLVVRWVHCHAQKYITHARTS